MIILKKATVTLMVCGVDGLWCCASFLCAMVMTGGCYGYDRGCYSYDRGCLHSDDILHEMSYVDLRINPERFTGYVGYSPQRIWNAIYRENCFK